MGNFGFNQAFSWDSYGFGNGYSYETPDYTAGIKNDLYDTGYYGDDLSWFNSRVPTATTFPANLIQDPASVTDPPDHFSRRWTGYFRPKRTEAYTFYLTSDDASMMWIGSVAKKGWTFDNAVVDNRGLHGPVEKSGTVNLVAGLYYPIQVFFGESGGGSVLSFSYSTPSIAKTTDLTDIVYYNPKFDSSNRGI